MVKDEEIGRAAPLSRREMLAAGAVLPLGLATSASASGPMVTGAQTQPAPAQVAAPAPAPAVFLEALETLTVVEMAALEAVCARLIPSDGHGPGAKEARAAHYIDRALAGPVRNQRGVYAAGLSALDAYARSAKGKVFAELDAADQDAVLHDLEAGTATGFTPGSAAFFNLVRAHTIEGTFCDPYYGGNANFVGWDLVGYPGLRMMVRAQDQRMVKPKTLRQSAYSANLFGRGADS